MEPVAFLQLQLMGKWFGESQLSYRLLYDVECTANQDLAPDTKDIWIEESFVIWA
jgi:hypothetical protein